MDLYPPGPHRLPASLRTSRRVAGPTVSASGLSALLRGIALTEAGRNCTPRGSRHDSTGSHLARAVGAAPRPRPQADRLLHRVEPQRLQAGWAEELAVREAEQ